MQRRHFLTSMSVGVSSLIVSGCQRLSGRPALPELDVAATMTLESLAFEANQPIPQVYTCSGPDISPPLRWSTPPATAQSLALVVTDPDAPGGLFTHWLVFNLPPDLRQLAEAASTALPEQARQGKNDFGQVGYRGPCPPSGTHRYVFTLYALDQQLDQPSGTRPADLLTAMQSHTLAKAELIGLFSR